MRKEKSSSRKKKLNEAEDEWMRKKKTSMVKKNVNEEENKWIRKKLYEQLVSINF